MRAPEYNFPEALQMLQRSGIGAREEAYGFSVSVGDGPDKMSAECGVDNDFSVSLAVTSGAPPAVWFFRQTALEIASLLLTAQRLLTEKKANNWIDALKAADHE